MLENMENSGYYAPMNLRISCTGCSLMDYIFTDIDFSAPRFKQYMSCVDGDGGLVPGKLVFTEEFETFAGKPFNEVLRDIIGDRRPSGRNLGGPAIVAVINTAQLCYGKSIGVRFYGGLGNDATGADILSIIEKTPVDTSQYKQVSGPSPCTYVFSDPLYDNGHGERAFVNTIGAAWNYAPQDIGESFFDADILVFGGTGLVPRIHDGLTGLLRKGKKRGSVTVVNTVYDFRNQKKNPNARWPLGESDETYRYIDVLIADREEALRLSGTDTLEEAASFFARSGVDTAVITHGAYDTYVFSQGSLFLKTELLRLPVSEAIKEEIRNRPEQKGDTTGCGDNFAGGFIASVARQLLDTKRGTLDVFDAMAWATASGGFACFYVGGTYVEKTPGEKLKQIRPYVDLYKNQIGRFL